MTKKLALLGMITLLTSSAAIAHTSADPNLATIVKQVMPSIVSIQVELPQEHGPLAELHMGRLASGVVIDAKRGYIVTNAHVVSDAKNIEVKLTDGEIDMATLVGLDKTSDIAVIQIQQTGLQALHFGNSDDAAVGDQVAAVGSPFGLTQSVTSGIISALQRGGFENGPNDNYIQTDAPINPGNSGGALVNMRGDFIGMNTAILSPKGGNIGIGFAIPSNIVKSIAGQLIQYGKVDRGVVGVMAVDLTPETAAILHAPSYQGALISDVDRYSPAATAGLKVGDIVTLIDDKPVENASTLVAQMALHRVGDHVQLTVLRNSKPLTISVALIAPDTLDTLLNQHDPYFHSMVLQTVSETTALQGSLQGIRIAFIEEETNNASIAGLGVDDVILSVNMQPVTTIAALQAIAAANQGKPLLLGVLRDTKTLFFTLKPATIKSP